MSRPCLICRFAVAVVDVVVVVVVVVVTDAVTALIVMIQGISWLKKAPLQPVQTLFNLPSSPTVYNTTLRDCLGLPDGHLIPSFP